MRLRVSHEIAISWEQPARSLMAALRLMPRDHEGQTVVSWRIEPSIDGRLRSSDDGHGNLLHLFQADGPLEGLTIRAEGVIETADTAGVVRGAREPAPPILYLRDTRLTPATEPLAALSHRATKGRAAPLDRAHALMSAVADRIDAGDYPAEGPDAAHALAAAARLAGLPARIAQGFADCKGESRAVRGHHHWTELHVEGIGWIAFDPALRLCPGERHVRVAVGLDAGDVEPLRVAGSSGGGESVRMTGAVDAG